MHTDRVLLFKFTVNMCAFHFWSISLQLLKLVGSNFACTEVGDLELLFKITEVGDLELQRSDCFNGVFPGRSLQLLRLGTPSIHICSILIKELYTCDIFKDR